MLVVHPFCEKEIDQMLNLFGWMFDLGGAKDHRCLLMCGFNVSKEDRDIMAGMASDIYGSVEVIRAYYEDPRPWPVNANLMWQWTATHIFQKLKCPWFWNEPDCIPLKANWLDYWELEFKTCGKSFMGCVVKEPHHLTGCAIYPPDVRRFSSEVMLCETHPWDVTDMPKILPHTHHSEQYHHQWFFNVKKPEGATYSPAATHFDSVNQLEIIDPKAVFFHRNKDGSLINMLRKRTLKKHA